MFSSTADGPYIFNQLTRSMEDTMKKNPAHKVLEDSSIVIPSDKVAEVVDQFSKHNPDLALAAIECADLLQSADLSQMFDMLQNDLEETKGLQALVKEMNTKLEISASAVLATDECRKEIDVLQNVIQRISEEGQTLRSLVTNIKSSHSQGLENLEGAVADLDARFSDYKDASQRSIRRKSELFRQCHSSIRWTLVFEAGVQTDLNLRLTALEKQVSMVRHSQDVHGQILHVSEKELGTLCLEFEIFRRDTHELQQACSSFWCIMVNEIENILNKVISEMNSLPPCLGDDLRDEMLRSDTPQAYAFLPVGNPAHQQLYAQVVEEDSVQTPCVEVASASFTVVHQPLIQSFCSKISDDLADARGLLALGKYLWIGILPNITVKDHIGRMHNILLDAIVGLLATVFWFGILDAALFLTVHWKGLGSIQMNICYIFATRLWKAKQFVLIAGAVVPVSMIVILSRVWWQAQTIPHLTEGYIDTAIHYY
ncbi:hypothetical protein F4604DRAFT_1920107 [Suillus subluteus]|nr:hypothetical protein F4604DRAFT_1920107 [Suillus subluteus]